MNVLTYNPDVMTKNTVIPLGRACECRATRIEFAVSSWLSRFPGGEIALYIKDPNGEMYLGDIRTENGVASWVLRESDTQVPGYGNLELALIGANGEKKLSAVATTKLEASLVESETDADYMQPWIERAAEIQAETAADAKSAATYAAVASTAASNAVEAMDAADVAREAAEAAQEAAEGAAQGAEESARAAEAAEDAAAGHAADAADSAQGADAAECAAQEAAQEAADSANVAAASAQEALTHAQAAQDVLASIPEDYTKLAEDAKTHAPRIVCDASGALVSVADAADRDALALVSSIKPTVNGVSAVTLTRTGRNLVSNLDYIKQNGHVNTVITADVIDVKSPTKFDYGRIPINFKAGVTYTLVIDWEVYGRDDAESGNTRASYYVGNVGTAATNVYIAGNGSKRIVRQYTFAEDTVGRISWCPNQDGDVAARSRSRIMLLEGAYTADTAPEFVPCDKQTLTASLPETVYGGTLEWASGLLTITHDADGAEMAEHRTIRLAPQTLEMLKGRNAVRSDTGNTSLTYIADTKLYIDNAVAALAASILNA